MKKFTVASTAATGFTALSLGLAVPALAGGSGQETVAVTGARADQLPHLCGTGPRYGLGHLTLTCLPRVALTPVTLP